MKIGILTHHSINNFGAFLQCWALQEKLRALFPQDEVCVINYIIPKQNIINIGGFFRFYPGTETPLSWLHKITQPILFWKNRKQHLCLTRKVYNAEQINALGLDCIVIGSDEVWNYLDPKSFSLIKFSAGLTAERIAAYAPSTGKATGTDAPESVCTAMRGFTDLSARDEGAQTLCKAALGITPALVCDPTFLASVPVVHSQKIDALSRKPYVLFYYCNGIPRDVKKKIIAHAREEGYEILGAGEYDKLYSRISVRLSPFEWAQLFRGAQYVFTGTFHGVVFSILNRKSFRVWASIDSRVKKIASLLRQFGIGDRSLTADLRIREDDPIDYDAVYRRIDRIREESTAYLLRAVKSERTHENKDASMLGAE